MAFLKKLEIDGFRSIRHAELEMLPINVLIGPNGAGKSNLVSFFQMLNSSLWGDTGLQDYVIKQGGASRVLHYGAKRTRDISVKMQFKAPNGTTGYRFNLTHADEDSLIYTSERVSFQKDGVSQAQDIPIGGLQSGAGHRQSLLSKPLPQEEKTKRIVKRFLNDCRVYHFHDTTPEGPLRRRWLLDDTTYLRANGENLPAYLYYLRETFSDSYKRITQTLQQLLPWFEDFYLEPEQDSLILRCRIAGQPDYPLTVRQLSDGSLRMMALVTLLRQPAERRPQLIVLDEPELGLHPQGEATIARLIRSVADENGQVLVATQSATFLSSFEPDDVIVVENGDGESKFNRHSRKELRDWLDRYSLGQVWLKNLIGGRP